eukprot:3896763-Prymnesium_polylepis.1
MRRPCPLWAGKAIVHTGASKPGIVASSWTRARGIARAACDAEMACDARTSALATGLTWQSTVSSRSAQRRCGCPQWAPVAFRADIAPSTGSQAGSIRVRARGAWHQCRRSSWAVRPQRARLRMR